jgi:hypothetical protein
MTVGTSAPTTRIPTIIRIPLRTTPTSFPTPRLRRPPDTPTSRSLRGDHPKIMSPLSKEKPGHAELVERYEPIVAGMEVGNGFSELNDPAEQRARFEDQLRLAARDEDTMVLDEPFLRAMEHGMPPASGLGIGIDRLCMFLTGVDQIREVILFPAMRPERTEGSRGAEMAGADPIEGDA